MVCAPTYDIGEGREIAIVKLTPLLLAAGLAIGATAHAEPTPPSEPSKASEPLTAERLLSRWRTRSKEVEGWRTAVGAARFDEISAGLLPNPEVGVDFVKLIGGQPPDGKFGVEGTLAVPLPIFGQVGAKKSLAKRNLEVAEMQVLVQLWDRAGALAATMVERAYLHEQLRAAERSLEELERIERVVQKRAAAGANGPYDLLRVQIARGQRTALRDNVQAARDQSEAKLLATLADPALGGAAITREGLRAFAGPDDEAALIRLALDRRPDLQLARRSVEASRAGADFAKKDARPVPRLSASPYWVGGPYGFQLTFGLTVPVPLFDRNQGQIGRANQETRGGELTVEVLTERVRAEVRGAYRARKAAAAALERYRRETIARTGELLHRAEVTYEAGAFSIAELFDAYEMLWSARDEEIALERQWAGAEVALEQAAVLIPLR